MDIKFLFAAQLNRAIDEANGLDEHYVMRSNAGANVIEKYKMRPPMLDFAKASVPEIKVGRLNMEVPPPMGVPFIPGAMANYFIFRIPIRGDVSAVIEIINGTRYYQQHYSIENGNLVYKHFETSIVQDNLEKLGEIKTAVKKIVEDFNEQKIKPLATDIETFNNDLTAKIEEIVLKKKRRLKKENKLKVS